MPKLKIKINKKKIFCIKCGIENPTNANFCKNCGNKIIN